ncbi:MAG: hypothetical protein H7Z13_05910 [Ferruginibacter sp.]|nr:hypothetical protein [Ferruginibacter sp.]
MEKIKWPVIIVTAYAFFYQLTPYIGFSDIAIMTMFMTSPIPVIWMAYKILKTGKSSQRSFDVYFYEDMDYKCNKATGVDG